jgi:hypothetical protein
MVLLITQALGKLREEDHKFKVILSFIARPCLKIPEQQQSEDFIIHTNLLNSKPKIMK